MSAALHARFNSLCRGTHFTQLMDNSTGKDGVQKLVKKWRCCYCQKVVQDNLTHLKEHLANPSACEGCSPEIRLAALSALPDSNKLHQRSASKKRVLEPDQQQPLFHMPSSSTDVQMSDAADHSSGVITATPHDIPPQPPAPPWPPELLNQPSLPFASVPSNNEHAAIEKAIGWFLFGSGRPFSLMEDPFFRNMIHTLRPGFELRHTDHYRDKILNQVHAELTAKVETRLAQAKVITWSCDDSEDVRKIGLANVIALTPAPCLVKATFPRMKSSVDLQRKLQKRCLPSCRRGQTQELSFPTQKTR